MKAKIYVGAKKYALYIGRKIVQKTLEFLSLPARFVSKKVQELKNLTMWGQSVQNGTPTPTAPVEVESVGDRTKNLFNVEEFTKTYPTNFEVDRKTGAVKLTKWSQELYGTGITVDFKAGSTISFTPISTGTYMSTNARLRFTYSNGSTFVLFITDGAGQLQPQQKMTLTNDVVNIKCDHTSDKADKWGISNFMVSEQATPYEPYGYKVPVTVGGKNLFSGDTKIYGLEVGKTYTISFTANDGRRRNVYAYDKDDTQLIRVFTASSIQTGYLSGSFVLPENTEYLFFQAFTTLDYETLQLELGDTATEYVLYTEPTTTNIYLNEPLRKIGDISDYIDFENKKVVRNIQEVNVSNLGIIKSTFSSHYRYNSKELNDLRIATTPVERRLIFCDKYPANNEPIGYTGNNPYGVSTYLNRIYFYNINLDNTTSTAQDFLNVGGVIIYILATPTEETIDLPTINLPQGTLTIDTATNIKPSKISITGDIDNE